MSVNNCFTFAKQSGGRSLEVSEAYQQSAQHDVCAAGQENTGETHSSFLQLSIRAPKWTRTSKSSESEGSVGTVGTSCFDGSCVSVRVSVCPFKETQIWSGPQRPLFGQTWFFQKLFGHRLGSWETFVGQNWTLAMPLFTQQTVF